MRVSAAIVFSCCVVLAGCECSTPEGRNDGGALRDGALLDGAMSSSDGSTRDGAMPRVDSGAIGAEVCDGIDNDRNGVIDDVDVGGDGICDCLAIGTLGTPGPWGAGNILADWLTERSSYEVVHLGSAELTAESLENLQVIVAQDMRGRTYSESEIAALETWIRAGGGLFTMIGYGDSSERTNINALLAPTGLSYGSNGILSGSPTVPIDTWHTHPVSMGVTRVGVDNGYPVQGGGTVVAEQSGHVLLRAIELGEGHVLVWGDEWISYDSEWTEHPDYQVERFWLNSFKWLTPANECQVPILI